MNIHFLDWASEFLMCCHLSELISFTESHAKKTPSDRKNKYFSMVVKPFFIACKIKRCGQSAKQINDKKEFRSARGVVSNPVSFFRKNNPGFEFFCFFKIHVSVRNNNYYIAYHSFPGCGTIQTTDA